MDVYKLCYMGFSTLVTPVWLLMIFAPRWPKTEKMMQSMWILAPFMLAYAILEIPFIIQHLPILATPQTHFAEITNILSSTSGTSLAWLHFIAVDLFVGRWVYLDSRKNNMNVALMAPILALCLLLCPLGFMLYLAAKKMTGQKTAVV